ncbi:type II secretion system F family protein [Domibacillus indicus]|uniref:competence type IV pilus assembly protein ComGB n=1 Tax=Domibacillus indicus TaxID=1437523 RepID=UPI002040C3F3|nr:competence type IV pilus assembly protein ComGB [Domibacillus indicus]MCM3788416.1 type II secretion system F family protein [Domibacillus indicus]
MDLSHARNGLAGVLAKRTSAKNGADFITRLGEMMIKGFSIGEAVEFLLMNIPDINKRQTNLIQKQLREGVPLHEILPVLHVPSLICLQIFFAEQHGNVQETLVHAGTQWSKTEQAKEKLVRLLQYPIFLLALLIVLLAVLNTFVLPQFRDLHASMGYEPKGMILLLLFFLQWAPPAVLITAPVLTGLLLLLYTRYKLLSPQKRADMIIKIPYMKTLFQLYFTRLFARESAQLLSSGFSVNELLHVFEEQTIYPMLREASKKINSQLMSGTPLKEAIANITWFDRKLPALISHGGANGRMGEELLLYASFCDQLIENKIKKATSIIQPAVFLMIGTVVMAVYLSVMLPMFEMIGSV